MRGLTLVSMLLLTAFAIPQTATASHCIEWNGLTLDYGYVVIDRIFSHTFPGTIVWVYAETNGVEGLQRGGADLFGEPDDCGYPNPDQAIARIAGPI